MGKNIVKIMFSMGCMGIVLMLWLGEKIPCYKEIATMGNVILMDSFPLCQSGQGGFVIMKEVLGGQPYFFRVDREEQQALVLAENKKDNVPGAEATEERIMGDVVEQETKETFSAKTVKKSNVYVEKLRQTLDTRYLWEKFYIVDSTTSVTKEIFDVKKLLEMNLRMKKKSDKVQILIYHTHGASEYFSDSEKGKIEDSIVGVGTVLAEELKKRGYGVYHDKTQYDMVNGKLDRNLAYNNALEGIEKIRKENPDIKVMIDLHRDAVGKGKHTYTTINGKKCAIVMFFNGMSRNKTGQIEYLTNPNLQGNLAFSLQLKCKAMEYFDGFTKPIYLKGYRYNLHLEKRSLLIELGNENNTIGEAKNAAAPIADILDKVLSGQD